MTGFYIFLHELIFSLAFSPHLRLPTLIWDSSAPLSENHLSQELIIWSFLVTHFEINFGKFKTQLCLIILHPLYQIVFNTKLFSLSSSRGHGMGRGEKAQTAAGRSHSYNSFIGNRGEDFPAWGMEDEAPFCSRKNWSVCFVLRSCCHWGKGKHCVLVIIYSPVANFKGF